MKHLGRGLLSSITVLSLLLLLATLLFWTRGRWSVDRFDASVVTGKIPFPAIRTGDGQVVNDSGQAQHGYLLRGLSGGGGLWVEIVRRRCAMRTAFHHTGYSKIGGAQAFFDKVFTRSANPICRNFGFPDCASPAGRTAFFSSMSPSISGPGSLPPSPRFCPRWRCFAGTPPGVAACSLPALAPAVATTSAPRRFAAPNAGRRFPRLGRFSSRPATFLAMALHPLASLPESRHHLM